jgi:hypothetical protein
MDDLEDSIRTFSPVPSPPLGPRGGWSKTRAGLLARGSSYSSHLPGLFGQWRFVSFVPTYSGGTAGGLHPFPFARVANCGDTLGPIAVGCQVAGRCVDQPREGG